MYFTSSAEDPEFREAAEAILLRAEDMIPRYGQSVWALSLQKVESTPEIKKLYKQFEEKKV